MSDYGLLSRNLVLNVSYQDSPTTFADAKVPVFAVGREQLCRMFALNGYPKYRIANVSLDLQYSDFEHANYAIMALGQWPNSDRIGVVYIFDVFQTFEQANLHVGLAMELDAENSLSHPYYPVYTYEIWQICDDNTLWHDWDLAADLYWNDECYDNWLAEISDGPHYYPTIVHKPVLMSEDYLSSLKTANARLVSQSYECCATCGDILSKPYCYCIDGLLVCRGCWLEYVNDLDARDADRPKYEFKEEGFVFVEGMGYC